MSLTRILAAVAMLGVSPALAQTDGDVISQLDQMFGSADPFVEAFQSIQTAVEEGDAETVAGWASYPFRANVDDREIEIGEPEGFYELYESIVTEDIADTIINQRFADLFVNADGVMFGTGEMWLTAICMDDACTQSVVRIITIQSTTE